MMLSANGRIRSVIKFAVLSGTFGSAVVPAVSEAQSNDAPTSGGPTQLQGVTVTGSLIRRSDRETSSPVLTVSRKEIEGSGATTLGELLEQLPSLTGDAQSQQVNNGSAGDGSATISLRGLGSSRTLTLLDGKRLVDADVNFLPVSMIERVEVLNEGAGTVYGSDAIGGVVNFITRKHFTGSEIESSYGGTTQRNDATKFDASFTDGVASSSGHAVFGVSYDRAGAIKGPDRNVSANALSIYYSQVSQAGSSKIPTGLFNLNSDFTDANGKSCDQVTRIPGAVGNVFNQTNFECRKSLPANAYTYNFNTENLVFTPADRIHLFALGEKQLTDSVSIYGSGVFLNSKSHNQLASEAFDDESLLNAQGLPAPVVISAASQYNPFGQDITEFKFRAVEAGDRRTFGDKNDFQGTVGIKAELLDRFEWDNSFTYGRSDLLQTSTGYFNLAGLAQELGPSKGGVCYTDATYTIPVPGCTPVNVIGTNGNGYSQLGGPNLTHTLSTIIQATSNISGSLLTLPAGDLSAAAGFEYRRYGLTSTPDEAEQSFQVDEISSASTHGTYDVKEVYGEFLIPIVKDLPGVHSLTFDGGVRYSNYSDFSQKETNKFAIEYRPVGDLLVRATYADIFRAPTISDLYGGAGTSAPTYSDPCKDYQGAPTAQYPNLPAACQNVPIGFVAPDTQGTVTTGGNPKLKPETGYTTDFGFVYSPNFYKPLSVEMDFYNYRIDHAITVVGLQTAIDSCATTGEAAYCNSYTREATPGATQGVVVAGTQVGQNVEDIFTSGFDFGVQLNYSHTPLGSFNFSLNGTYLDQFRTAIPGVVHYSQAGQVAGADLLGGGFPRVKFTGSLDWGFHGFDVILRNRYISTESDNGGQDGQGNTLGVDASGAGYIGNGGECNTGQYSGVTTAAFPGGAGIPYTCRRQTGYRDYQDLQVSYTIKPINTKLSVGMNDIFDQRAPIEYTQGPAFNYDSSNYDVIGRFVYARVKVSFK